MVMTSLRNKKREYQESMARRIEEDIPRLQARLVGSYPYTPSPVEKIVDTITGWGGEDRPKSFLQFAKDHLPEEDREDAKTPVLDAYGDLGNYKAYCKRRLGVEYPHSENVNVEATADPRERDQVEDAVEVFVIEQKKKASLFERAVIDSFDRRGVPKNRWGGIQEGVQTYRDAVESHGYEMNADLELWKHAHQGLERDRDVV